MITIRYDNVLELVSQRMNMAPELIARKIVEALSLDDDDDHYAGETLNRLLSEDPVRHIIFRGTELYDDPLMYELTLWRQGAEIPCPLCGWEMAVEEEGDYIIGYTCPHCGHSRLELPPDA